MHGQEEENAWEVYRGIMSNTYYWYNYCTSILSIDSVY